MATFVLLATCHHCNLSSGGLVYRDSLSVLSRNLRAPGCCPRPPAQATRRLALQNKHRSRLSSGHRSDPPESIAVARSKPAGGMKRLVLAQLRKLLTLSSAHRSRERGLHPPL